MLDINKGLVDELLFSLSENSIRRIYGSLVLAKNYNFNIVHVNLEESGFMDVKFEDESMVCFKYYNKKSKKYFEDKSLYKYLVKALHCSMYRPELLY